MENVPWLCAPITQTGLKFATHCGESIIMCAPLVIRCHAPGTFDGVSEPIAVDD